MPAFVEFYFYKSEAYEQKISTKRVRNLSQSAPGNGHFRYSNFETFLGDYDPRPPRKIAPSVLVVPPPFESPGSVPGE